MQQEALRAGRVELALRKSLRSAAIIDQPIRKPNSTNRSTNTYHASPSSDGLDSTLVDRAGESTCETPQPFTVCELHIGSIQHTS